MRIARFTSTVYSAVGETSSAVYDMSDSSSKYKTKALAQRKLKQIIKINLKSRRLINGSSGGTTRSSCHVTNKLLVAEKISSKMLPRMKH